MEMRPRDEPCAVINGHEFALLMGQVAHCFHDFAHDRLCPLVVVRQNYGEPVDTLNQ